MSSAFNLRRSLKLTRSNIRHPRWVLSGSFLTQCALNMLQHHHTAQVPYVLMWICFRHFRDISKEAKYHLCWAITHFQMMMSSVARFILDANRTVKWNSFWYSKWKSNWPFPSRRVGYCTVELMFAIARNFCFSNEVIVSQWSPWIVDNHALSQGVCPPICHNAVLEAREGFLAQVLLLWSGTIQLSPLSERSIIGRKDMIRSMPPSVNAIMPHHCMQKLWKLFHSPCIRTPFWKISFLLLSDTYLPV